jgi:hypothetical protein
MLESRAANRGSVLPGPPWRGRHGPCGAVAQLGERRVRNAKVEGSIPFRSIPYPSKHLHPRLAASIPARPVGRPDVVLVGLDLGERMCCAFELYRHVVTGATLTMEHFILLVLALAEGTTPDAAAVISRRDPPLTQPAKTGRPNYHLGFRKGGHNLLQAKD